MAERSIYREIRSAGFSSPFGASEARRQLHLTVGLVTVLSIGIVSAAVTVGNHPLAATQDVLASHAPATLIQAESKVSRANAI